MSMISFKEIQKYLEDRIKENIVCEVNMVIYGSYYGPYIHETDLATPFVGLAAIVANR